MKSDRGDHKRVTIEFFNLVGQGKFKEGLRYFRTDCITHNPYVKGGMETLISAMVSANMDMASKYPNAEFTIKHVMADEDMMAVQTQLLNDRNRPNDGGLRQVHLFRFEGDMIAEYWDITQLVTSDMPNADGAF